MSAVAPDARPLSPCPHCGAASRVERSKVLRWRCGVCGGPIVPTDGVARSNRELASLVRSQRARAMAVGWTATAYFFGAVGVMGVAVALLVGLASHGMGVLLGVLAVVALGIALVGRGRASARNAEARVAIDEAWQHVASDVLRARGGDLTAAEMSRVMQTDGAHAEAMLAELSATGRARVDVREDAELTYRVAPDAPESTETPGPDALREKTR